MKFYKNKIINKIDFRIKSGRKKYQLIKWFYGTGIEISGMRNYEFHESNHIGIRLLYIFKNN